MDLASGSGVVRRRAAWSAYAAAGLFVLGLLRFALPGTGVDDGTIAGAAVAAAPHLVLLLGVWPALQLPRWAGAAGLVWLLLDLLSDVLAVAGMDPGTYLAVRYTGHLFAAVWIGGLAVRARGGIRIVGVLLAALLGGYTPFAAWVPPIALAPTGPLLVAWWLLVGRSLARGYVPGWQPVDAVSPDGSQSPALRRYTNAPSS